MSSFCVRGYFGLGEDESFFVFFVKPPGPGLTAECYRSVVKIVQIDSAKLLMCLHFFNASCHKCDVQMAMQGHHRSPTASDWKHDTQKKSQKPVPEMKDMGKLGVK